MLEVPLDGQREVGPGPRVGLCAGHRRQAPVTAANTVVQVDPTAGTRQPEGTGGTEQIIVRVEGRTPPAAGSTIWVAPDAEHLHLFDAATGTRLPD